MTSEPKSMTQEAAKASSEEAVSVLHQLAQEEKSHLKILGKLMDGLKPPH